MGFVSLVFAAVVLIHYYLWRRLVGSTTRPGRTRRVLTWVIVGLGVLAPVTLIVSRSAWGHFLAWPGFFWLAVMFYLFVFLVVLEVPRAVALLVLRVLERRAGRRHAPDRVAARRAARAESDGSVPVSDGFEPGPDGSEPVPAGTVPAFTAEVAEAREVSGAREASRAREVLGAAGAVVAAGSRTAVPADPVSALPQSEPESQRESPSEPQPPSDSRPEPRTGAESGSASEGVVSPAGRRERAMSRRLFITRTAAVVAGTGALGTVGFGVRTALGDPVVESVEVALPRLDPRLSGLRFAVVSDIHLGPLTGLGHAERIVRMVNALQADVVAVVGDLVDGTVAELGPLARPLRGLESRYGAYFVTGNHEYYTANGPREWIEELRELGVRPLVNERVEIAHAGAVLDLAGVNDVAGAASDDGPDFERALGGRDRSRSTVLLAHQPVQAAEAARHGVDLQLSGHTHGGQMVPFNLVVPLQQPVVSGLGEVDGTRVYVTRGAGFWGPPVRVGAPPEITLLELRNEKL
ncbi:hypothetical protein GCM10010517_01080 [Streptosporangium fragile]|uniref:Calcineurin-like phosphoesterase domain-containing protein n=1 Tax=Streptosporangium fragile TaxID=46186 RepID=A0ABN3VQ73_9ACTN